MKKETRNKLLIVVTIIIVITICIRLYFAFSILKVIDEIDTVDDDNYDLIHFDEPDSIDNDEIEFVHF